jgi:hypothetical protein
VCWDRDVGICPCAVYPDGILIRLSMLKEEKEKDMGTELEWAYGLDAFGLATEKK